MLRSLFSGLSGLRGHQIYLDTVGHNVANVNTTGYKKSVASFQDLLYQTTRIGSTPGETQGGINPMQIGHGSIIGSIDTYLTQGDVQFTGNHTNAAIEGNGYFVMRDGEKQIYARAGNFVYDGARNIVQSGTGYLLQGYSMTEDPDKPGQYITGAMLTDINVPLGQKQAAKATTVSGYRCNLDGRVDAYLPMGMLTNDVTSTAVFNNSGTPTTYTMSFAEGTTIGEFATVTATNPDGTTNGTITFQFQGVDDSGLPQLAVSGTPSGIFAAPATVTYDSATGQLQVENTTAGSEGTWKFNMAGIMDYKVLEVPVTTSAGPPPVTENRKYLADFGDVAADGSRTVTLWGPDSATPPTYGVVQATVRMTADGEFAASDPSSAGWAFTNLDPAGADLTVAGQPFDATNAYFPSTDGRSLELKRNGTTVSGATVAQRAASIHNATQLVYDSEGKAHPLTVSWEKVDNNTWRWRAWISNEDGSVADITVTDADGNPATGLITFDKTGKIENDAAPSVVIGFSSGGAENSTVKLDFSGASFDKGEMEGVTQYGSAFSTRGYVQDGHSMSTLVDISYSPDGTLLGIYDDESTVPLYRVPLALFSNPEGLEKLGESVYGAGPNTGVPALVFPTESGAGKLTGSSLEMSNVDITEEFINLIRGQRGYQANARIVTTSDQILEETLNIKR